jgi:hypothetical protein
VVGKFFKLAKPAAKAMDDIKISLRGDGDWERDIDGMWSGGNWVNYSFEALTDKGKQILNKLTKGKKGTLVDEGDGVYTPNQGLGNESEFAVEAVDAIKKSKGKISLNTRVGSKVKGAKKGYKTYSGKNINKQNILDEVDDMYAHDMGGYSKKQFDNEYVEMMIDEIVKKAEGGRVGLGGGGLLKLAEKIWKSKFLNKKFLDPKKLADETDDAGRELRKRNLLGQDKWSDIPKTLRNALYVAGGGTGVASLLKYLEQRLGSVDALKEDNVLQDLVDNEGVFEKAEGGRIGLDTGGPPIEPYSTSDPKAAAKEMARRYIEMIAEPAKVPIDKDIQLMFDLDRAKIGGTKDFLGGEIDFGINKGFGRDDMGYGFNWSKKFSDGGSVLQRPMFYQGGLTKTVPPERGPMPQGLQSDVYDGIMRLGVINGRN